MVTLRVLLVLCAATAAQSAMANGQTTVAQLRAACGDDAQRLCAGVQLGGGKMVACLKEHKDQLSNGCRQAAGLPPLNPSSPAPGAPGATPASGANAPAGGAPSGTGRAPAATSPAAGAAGGSVAASAGSAAGSSVSAAGEKFVERVITDTQHGGMRVTSIHVPEKWHFESKMEWHYNWIENPLSYSLHAENPDNAEAYFQYPALVLESTEVAPQLRQYNRGKQPKPGDRMDLGAIYCPPMPPVQTLALFIKKVRPDVANLKWIGQQDLPDLAKVLKLPTWPNQHGIAIKIGYDLNGQPVEEAFFGVYYLAKVGNDAVGVGQWKVGAGQVQQTNWGFDGLQSMRAPAGTLDKRMPMFCLMAKSMDPNPVWVRLVKAINDKLQADFNQKLKQGLDQIRAAQAIMEQTMRDQAAFQANFDKQEEAFRNSPGVDDSNLRDGGGGSGSGKRSSSDHFDDLIRGVDTMNDPSTGGTTQLSSQGQYHFTDGFGNYRTSDNPNYTPEQAGEVGSWTLMTAAP